MTYPIPNYERVWVRGRIIDLTKAAREEQFYGVGLPITFTPNPKTLINRGTKQIIMTGSFKVDTSKEDGYFQVALPPTDDPDIVPEDFSYRVIEPGTGRAYDFKLPHDTPYLYEPGHNLHGKRVVELSDVVPAATPSGGTVQLMTGRSVWQVQIRESDSHLIGEFSDGVWFDAGLMPVASVNGYLGHIVLNKADVGLGNANNTSDANKPVSTATQAALDTKASNTALNSHTSNTSNPHSTTKAQVGLGNVDNTSDTAKPVSTAQQTAINSAQSGAQAYADTADTNHVNASDPHANYYNTSRGDARWRKIVDPVTVPGVNGLSSNRLVGTKTTTGVPTSGTWLTGDMAYNSADRKWMLCTAGGTPGTWTIQP